MSNEDGKSVIVRPDWGRGGDRAHSNGGDVSQSGLARTLFTADNPIEQWVGDGRSAVSYRPNSPVPSSSSRTRDASGRFVSTDDEAMRRVVNDEPALRTLEHWDAGLNEQSKAEFMAIVEQLPAPHLHADFVALANEAAEEHPNMEVTEFITEWFLSLGAEDREIVLKRARQMDDLADAYAAFTGAI